MKYYAYEMAHAVLTPVRWGVKSMRLQLESPLNPFGDSLVGRNMAAGCELFEDITKRYSKPDFGIEETRINGVDVPVREHVARHKPFCDLVHFEKDRSSGVRPDLPTALLIAPMSGHYATLLRGTVRAMLPEHDVYITDWIDARDIPLAIGGFDLDDFIDYLIEFVQFLGPNTNIVAVCQPSVPALAATALMALRQDPCQPATLTMMGGPIDTRRNPTKVNELAEKRSIEWFENTVISRVPWPNAGFMRRVYPGFIQLSGFMSMNMDRHISAHRELFNNLVKGDCDSVQQHRKFYDEYLAVMDLPAEFYLQTVKTVFQDHALADGKFVHRGEPIDLAAIEKTALMTVEGEKDDICGLGQTEAAHALCPGVRNSMKVHYVQPGVGHYGVFNGTRWRTEIQPRIREFIYTQARGRRVKRKSSSHKSARLQPTAH